MSYQCTLLRDQQSWDETQIVLTMPRVYPTDVNRRPKPRCGGWLWRRAHTVAEGEMMSRKREYKDVMQKLVGRQSVHGSTEERRKNKQRQALYQIRQDISEARFETNEAITQIHKGVKKLEPASADSSSFDSGEKEYGSSETLRAMQDLLRTKQETSPSKKGETSGATSQVENHTSSASST